MPFFTQLFLPNSPDRIPPFFFSLENPTIVDFPSRVFIKRQTDGLPYTHTRTPYIYIHRIYVYMYALLKKENNKKRSLCQASFYRFIYTDSSSLFSFSHLREEGKENKQKKKLKKKNRSSWGWHNKLNHGLDCFYFDSFPFFFCSVCWSPCQT